MISIQNFVFNPFEVNTYVLFDETKECIIIDAGCYTDNEKNELRDFIDQNNLKPITQYSTHGHVDHLAGNAYISSLFNIKTGAHKLDKVLFDNVVEHGIMLGFEIEQPSMDVLLEDNEDISFGNSSLRIRHIPGHSPGSIVFYSENQKFVIVGDVLFSGSIGRTDLPGGNYQTLISGIKEKLLALDDDIIVYSGHGPETTIGTERVSNPFLLT